MTGTFIPGRQVRISISAADKAAMAYAARAGARSGDRISRHEALHLSPVARAHRAARVQPRQARRRRRRHRRRARLGQQSIPGGLLCRSNDGGCLADGERPSVAGTDRLHDQSRGLVGASRQRRIRADAGRHQAATAQGEAAGPDVGPSGAANRRAYLRRRI